MIQTMSNSRKLLSDFFHTACKNIFKNVSGIPWEMVIINVKWMKYAKHWCGPLGVIICK